MKKLLLCLAPLLVSCSQPPAPSLTSPSPTAAAELPHSETPPDKGQQLFTQTYQLLPSQFQARLNCNSCHLAGGTSSGAFALVGVAKTYPKLDPRLGHKITIRQRINECFTRSLNGRPLDEKSPEMEALLAYLDTVQAPPGKPAPVPGLIALAAPPQPADPKRGASVYNQKCVECHQADGGGQYVDNLPLFPALWGDKAYNDGAGLAQPKDLASFVHAKMPLGRTRAISPQEAWDVAAFIDSQPRPAYTGKPH
ncbi:hypothetical protein ABS71_16090 [bacterium SCN 62-11]|nr:c-type cytochrome [Candidatus Eremiobacteraeota bacterium]ODT62186.1 MAG: hypothetical protein ABS71_16090 [bacterium SCN 62-11]